MNDRRQTSIDNIDGVHVEPPLARTGDPDTSHAGDADVTYSGRRAAHKRAILAQAKRRPGSTARELAEACGIDGGWKRVSDLVTDGVLYRGPKRRCNVTGRKAYTVFAKAGV